jgi:uracil-DNA glycosylase
MKSMETLRCDKCPEAEYPNWGIEGEANEKPIMIVLECSDFRAIGIDYEEGLFNSRTGQTLRNIIGDRFGQVIITNAAKCLFEGGKRKPNAGEYAKCAANLHEQIALVKPKIVLCLGEKAAEAVTGEKFRDVLGKVIDNVVVAHHPRTMTREEKKMIREMIEISLPQTA